MNKSIVAKYKIFDFFGLSVIILFQNLENYVIPFLLETILQTIIKEALGVCISVNHFLRLYILCNKIAVFGTNNIHKK